ncbi:hypothetical protein GCM10010116_35310 [Microbispora rosea subsp. aerata]|nr:hypothetical protein GCM10010116_35310 [Microbispora rosea subsp. aerata]GIH56545.1 hypothetical protein Mro02_34590 [Microbispora rosea subsp. aerata]GLJ81926.1 hypothetical protein GCM10017588_06510 [Microbispora rosea subsp. aerata]
MGDSRHEGVGGRYLYAADPLQVPYAADPAAGSGATRAPHFDRDGRHSRAVALTKKENHADGRLRHR